MLKATTAPYLACDRQYRAIEVEIVENTGWHFENGKKTEMVSDRPRLARLSTRRDDPEKPPSRRVVKNSGTGPALNCKARFITTQINLISNSPARIEEQEIDECIVDPRNIMPGHDAQILGMPQCFDLKRFVADAQGYMVFECEQLDGTKLEFKETFDIWQGFGAKPYPLVKMQAWGREFPWNNEELRSVTSRDEAK